MKLTFMITIMTHLITFSYVQLPIAMTLQYPLNAQMIVMTMIPIKTFTSTWTLFSITLSVFFTRISLMLLKQTSLSNQVKTELLRLLGMNTWKLVLRNVRMMMGIGWLLMIIRLKVIVLVNVSLGIISCMMDRALTVLW